MGSTTGVLAWAGTGIVAADSKPVYSPIRLKTSNQVETGCFKAKIRTRAWLFYRSF
jgi:hypothetical protein